MLEPGISVRVIVQRIGCHHSTITILHTRYRERCVTTPSPGQRRVTTPSPGQRRVTAPSPGQRRVTAPSPGQRRVTAPRQDRHSVLLHIRDRTLPTHRTAPTVQGRRSVIPADTARHRRPSAALRAHRPHLEPILTDRHRNERQRWAGRNRHWRSQLWHGVLFSNESHFHLTNADGRF